MADEYPGSVQGHTRLTFEVLPEWQRPEIAVETGSPSPVSATSLERVDSLGGPDLKSGFGTWWMHTTDGDGERHVRHIEAQEGREFLKQFTVSNEIEARVDPDSAAAKYRDAYPTATGVDPKRAVLDYPGGVPMGRKGQRHPSDPELALSALATARDGARAKEAGKVREVWSSPARVALKSAIAEAQRDTEFAVGDSEKTVDYHVMGWMRQSHWHTESGAPCLPLSYPGWSDHDIPTPQAHAPEVQPRNVPIQETPIEVFSAGGAGAVSVNAATVPDPETNWRLVGFTVNGHKAASGVSAKQLGTDAPEVTTTPFSREDWGGRILADYPKAAAIASDLARQGKEMFARHGQNVSPKIGEMHVQEADLPLTSRGFGEIEHGKAHNYAPEKREAFEAHGSRIPFDANSAVVHQLRAEAENARAAFERSGLDFPMNEDIEPNPEARHEQNLQVNDRANEVVPGAFNVDPTSIGNLYAPERKEPSREPEPDSEPVAKSRAVGMDI
ncbi:hypothetical protein CKO28_14355 [Rhodovibrio sodomensis]|uniref:Uncharacterized protein n=1 Tax=Rhodovibrio sodomensis TaxID=1088 RepID=A0ABS1DGT9_9PROT|nr:hypothetical protein [Rhodovibrio sodomensis]MBK1669216.1 hypothetical protein [Rhodovibrio sodomensis]